MEWCDYYEKFYDWAESTQISRISGLTGFQESSEVAEIVENIFDTVAASRLVRKAMEEKVRFTAEEVIAMLDYLSEDVIVRTIKTCRSKFTSEQLDTLADYCIDEDVIIQAAKAGGNRYNPYDDEMVEESEPEEGPPKAKDFGLLKGLFVAGAIMDALSPKARSDRCDGNCAQCPAHYGYRYGRWYYGHGHQHGCERGGNGGASGKCHSD